MQLKQHSKNGIDSRQPSIKPPGKWKVLTTAKFAEQRNMTIAEKKIYSPDIGKYLRIYLFPTTAILKTFGMLYTIGAKHL